MGYNVVDWWSLRLPWKHLPAPAKVKWWMTAATELQLLPQQPGVRWKVRAVVGAVEEMRKRSAMVYGMRSSSLVHKKNVHSLVL